MVDGFGNAVLERVMPRSPADHLPAESQPWPALQAEKMAEARSEAWITSICPQASF
jgi:hypothetical protein